MTKVVHEARSADESARLRAAAEAVRRVRPPGIVRIVSIDENDDGTVVVVTDEPEPDATISESESDASVFAAAATALAALHAHDVVHGAIAAAPLRRDPAGRAVLPLPAWRDPMPTASVDDDVDALCMLVGERDARSARDLAARLVAPSPRVLRTKSTIATTSSALPRPRRRATAFGALTAVAGVVTMGVALLSPSSTARPSISSPTRATTASTSTTAAPVTVPASSERVIDLDGHRFEVGVPGDLVVLGVWSCDPTARPTPALVRPSTGDVFVFDTIAPDATVTPVTRLDAVTGAGRVTGDDGCDRLVVDSAGERRVVATNRRATEPQPRSPATDRAP